ncbi:MAG TPA: RtcB family protein [Deltaproteobacteria bacterium]|nr:RtcB family protein [Deltaproteobacteria bacterium]
MDNYDVIQSGKGLIKAWTRGVPVEDAAWDQLGRIAQLPFVHKWVAAMPDVHLGRGATVGSVIPTTGAIVPAAVGVDIGCGMMAVRTSLSASELPDGLAEVRAAIEGAVPHGRTRNGGSGDRGAWGDLPEAYGHAWNKLLMDGWKTLCDKHPKLARGNTENHLGTLGTGNHFIEVCLDEVDRVWIMLHSGSRGVGNRIGQHFIRLAKGEMERWYVSLPDMDLAYLPEGTEHFDDYVEAVGWAQEFARLNRALMMQATVSAMQQVLGAFSADEMAVNCHHNYVTKEHHFGKNVWVTRKGAVRAGPGDLGIIPGSMGARSYIVRGKGSTASFHSCSHGAGRAMSRTAARRRFTVEDHVAATEGVECRKDEAVIDETPMAYKDIDAVMAAQADLVQIVHTLKQIVCVKG